MQEKAIDHGEVLDFHNTEALLRVIQAKNSNLNLTNWSKSYHDYLDLALIESGAIVFRGFAMKSPEDLETLVSSITPGLVNYIEGSSPRTRLTEKVYTSTEYPPEFDISMHNELSYAHAWPSKLFFFCLTAPQKGGETPIADSRKVYRLLDKAILEAFAEKGVKYVRNLHGGRGVGLSWQTVFETDDKSVVERYCEEGGIEYEWTRRGRLRTSQVRPAIIKHPVSGEVVWFNQADQWHPTNLPKDVRDSMLAVASEKDLPINAYYGDGSPLDPEVLDTIRSTYRQATVKFPWHEGDVLLIDNTMVAHGRSAFSGQRKIVLSMGGTVNLSDVDVISHLI